MLKNGALLHILEKLGHLIKKNHTEVASTNYTSHVKFQINFKIKPRRR